MPSAVQESESRCSGRPVSVSVVVLTRNGGQLFRRVLNALMKQRTPFEYEVIVVDSGSSDGCCEYARRSGARVYEVSPRDFSFGTTRDLGFGLARGGVIATISQDALPVGSSWLVDLVGPCLRGEAVVQGLFVLPRETTGVFFWERDGRFWFTTEGEVFFRKVGGVGLSCAHMAIRRDAWLAARFAGAPYCEDKLLQQRLWEMGVRVAMSDAVVEHAHAYSFKSLVTRCYMEGVGWSFVDTRYEMSHLVRDLTNGEIWSTWAKALTRGHLRSVAEVLFPLVRPVCLYLGFTLGRMGFCKCT